MGLTWSSPDIISNAVRKVRKTVDDAPFQGNFALAFPPTGLRAALGAGLPIVTFSWGDPAPHIPICRSHGAMVGVQVTSLDEAKRMIGLGVDFLIVQGIEAGGHVQSTMPLFELIPVIAALGTPVVAAGGLTDGVDIRRALNASAQGAMLGTRFVATQESLAHEIYKARLLECDETELTLLFDGGWPNAPHRALRNSTFKSWEAAGCPPSGKRPGEGEIVGQGPGGKILRYEDTAPRAGFSGQIEAMCLYAGSGVGRISDLPSAAELIQRLSEEAGL
jgi:nitronate monooxygenase